MTENEILNYLEAYGLRARNAAAVLAVAPAGVKNAALSNAAELLVRRDALPRGFTAERTTLEEIVLLLSASAETKEKIV